MLVALTHAVDRLTYRCLIRLHGDCPVPSQPLPNEIKQHLTWRAGLCLESCGSSWLFQTSAVGPGETAGVAALLDSLI